MTSKGYKFLVSKNHNVVWIIPFNDTRRHAYIREMMSMILNNLVSQVKSYWGPIGVWIPYPVTKSSHFPHFWSNLGAPDGVSQDVGLGIFLSAGFGINFKISRDMRLKSSKGHLECVIRPRNSCGMREKT